MDKEMGMNYIKIGLNIAYYRKLKGVTQLELAEAIGRSKEFIGRLEAPNIYAKPSLDTLFKMANYFEIPVSRLLEFRD